MSRWRSIWLVARARDPRARPEPRLHLSRAVHDGSSWSARSSCRRSCFGDDEATKVGVVEPRAGRPRGGDRSDRRRGSTRPSIVTDRTRTAAAAEAALDGRTRSTPSSTSRPTCPAPGEVRSTRSADQASPQIIVGAPSIGLRVAGRPGRQRRRPGRARRRPAAAGGRAARPADRGRPGALPLRQHRGRPDPHRHLQFGFTVLTGVVEEKQSRVVEVVLSTVRPRDLLMGKVLGIGVLGLVQLVVFVGAALIAAARSRTGSSLPATTPGAVALLAVWFVLGYALYSTALGFLGALASRMEEASNASTPGHDGRDDQLLRGDLRGHRRPGRDGRARSRRSSRRRRRSSSRCGPRSTRSRRGRSACPIAHHAGRRSGSLFVDRRRGSTRAPCSRPAGRMKLRDAWRSAGE